MGRNEQKSAKSAKMSEKCETKQKALKSTKCAKSVKSAEIYEISLIFHCKYKGFQHITFLMKFIINLLRFHRFQ